ncbi:MAG: PHP domain-containing protein [Actinomycetota bacterium]
MTSRTAALLVDAHVHSTFSDGRDAPETNVAVAEERGLRSISIVDHVRRDTDWVGDFVRTIRAIDRRSPLDVRCGVEAKLLDTAGGLDLPASLVGIDHILVADHQVPLEDGLHAPAAVRRRLEQGDIAPSLVIDHLVEATAAAAERHDGVVIAHLFSALPKCGLSELDVDDARVEALAARLAHAGATVEISERWSCPSLRVARILSRAGVPLVASTDSHRSATIGTYSFVAEILGPATKD